MPVRSFGVISLGPAAALEREGRGGNKPVNGSLAELAFSDRIIRKLMFNFENFAAFLAAVLIYWHGESS
jgi:uncharacterized MAPEG superfamily protein